MKLAAPQDDICLLETPKDREDPEVAALSRCARNVDSG
jgi:hypothetical protein